MKEHRAAGEARRAVCPLPVVRRHCVRHCASSNIPRHVLGLMRVRGEVEKTHRGHESGRATPEKQTALRISFAGQCIENAFCWREMLPGIHEQTVRRNLPDFDQFNMSGSTAT